MNYLIQRGKVRGQVINVPNGLPELLSDITREVLRCQPNTECLCQFIIDYLHSVIVTREKAKAAQIVIDRALRSVDAIISEMCICEISKHKSDIMSAHMEECFKRYLEKRRCERRMEKEIIKFNEEDLLDEMIEKCRFTEQELKVSRPIIEEAYNRFIEAYMTTAQATEGTEVLYQYFKEREERRLEQLRREQAATRIQSSFRGYMVRRVMFKKDDKGRRGSITTDKKMLDEMNMAAAKIQKFFRQYFKSQRIVLEVSMLQQPDDEEEAICEAESQISMEPKDIMAAMMTDSSSRPSQEGEEGEEGEIPSSSQYDMYEPPLTEGGEEPLADDRLAEPEQPPPEEGGEATPEPGAEEPAPPSEPVPEGEAPEAAEAGEAAQPADEPPHPEEEAPEGEAPPPADEAPPEAPADEGQPPAENAE